MDALDWQLLVDALTERAATAAGARQCASLRFAEDIAEARQLLTELAEMLALAELGTSPQLGGIEDIALAVEATSKGEVLSGEVLLSIGQSLEGLDRLRRQLQELAEEAPRLAGIALGIEPLPDRAPRPVEPVPAPVADPVVEPLVEPAPEPALEPAPVPVAELQPADETAAMAPADLPETVATDGTAATSDDGGDEPTSTAGNGDTPEGAAPDEPSADGRDS